MPHDISTVSQKIAIGIAAIVASSWLIYFVFAPTIGFDLLGSWHNEQRALQVWLLVATSLSYVWLALQFSVVRITAPLWIVFAFGVVSACLSELPFHAAAEVALTLQLVSLAAFVATLVRLFPQYAEPVFFSASWIIGAVYVIGVAANYIGVIVARRPVDLEVFVLGYANQRFASALHALVLPLLAWLAMGSPKRSLRYSSWIIAALLWAINLAMGTRAIWVAYFLTAIAFWWQGGAIGRRVVKVVGATAAAGAVVYLLAWGFVPAVLPQVGSMHSRAGELATASSRSDLWRAAIDAILAHPWFGIGPMHFSKLELGAGAHPHDWLLQFAAEWGLPALLAIFFAIYLWLRRMRNTPALPDGPVNSGVLPVIGFSVLAAIAYGLMDGNWVMPISQSLGAIFFGASVGLFPPIESIPSKAIGKGGIAMLFVVLAAAGVLGWYTYTTVGLQNQIEKDYVAEHHVRYFLPRFWQQGFIGEQPSE